MAGHGMPDPADVVDVDREAFREWEYERQHRAVREAVGAPEYFPPEEKQVAPDDCTLYNPGIAAYLETHDWGERGWEPVGDTRPYRSAPAYLPTDEAIKTLADMRLVEVGAGSGYWAHVVEHAGGDIVPTDLRPPEVAPEADLPATTRYVSDDGDRTTHCQTLWPDVHVANHQSARNHADRDVLLCHPPGNEWTEEILDLLRPSQRLIYVGEWYPGADATPRFHRRLHANWEMEEMFPVLDWQSMHARGYVFAPE